MWESTRGDKLKRILQIDGPTRLVKYSEQINEGPGRYKGTRVTLYLTKDFSTNSESSWEFIKNYLEEECVDLPYNLELQYVDEQGEMSTEYINPIKKNMEFPDILKESSLTIEVDDNDTGLKGEIVLFNTEILQMEIEKHVGENKFILSDEKSFWNDVKRGPYEYRDNPPSILIRGGFKISTVPGLPQSSVYNIYNSIAQIYLDWKKTDDLKYPLTNLARAALADNSIVKDSITRIIVTHLIENSNNIPIDFLSTIIYRQKEIEDRKYLENYNAFDLFNIFFKCLIHVMEIPFEDYMAWKNGGQKLLVYYHYKARKESEHGLYRVILDMLLINISKPVVRENMVLLKPPIKDWEDTLKNLVGFQSHNEKWGLFAEFDEGYKDALYINTLMYEFFNEKYRTVLESNFDKNELQLSMRMLSRLDDYVNQKVSQKELEVLNRLKNLVGDVKVIPFSGNKKWTLNERLN